MAFRLTTQTDPQELGSRTHRSNRPAPRDSLRAGTPAGGGAGATAPKLSVGADQPNHLKALIQQAHSHQHRAEHKTTSRKKAAKQASGTRTTPVGTQRSTFYTTKVVN